MFKIWLFLTFNLYFLDVYADPLLNPRDIKATVTVQATNNTLVPSLAYIVDAVECLEEAYSIYEDDENRALLYSALFEEKHNGTWNVVVGQTAFYVHSSIYVETVVLGEENNNKKNFSDDKGDTGKLFLIFSAD